MAGPRPGRAYQCRAGSRDGKRSVPVRRMFAAAPPCVGVRLYTLRKRPVKGEKNIPRRLKPDSCCGGYGTAGSRAPSKRRVFPMGQLRRVLGRLVAGARTMSDTARSFGICLALLFGTITLATAQPVPLPPGTSGSDQEQQKPASDPLEDVESAIEAKNYALAASRLDIYVSAHPEDGRGLFDRGYVEDAQGHSEAAERWYRKAIAADPKQFESRLALGLLLAAKGDAQ